MSAKRVLELHLRGAEVARELVAIDDALKGTTPDFYEHAGPELRGEILRDLRYRDERGKDLECMLALYPLPEVAG